MVSQPKLDIERLSVVTLGYPFCAIDHSKLMLPVRFLVPMYTRFVFSDATQSRQK